MCLHEMEKRKKAIGNNPEITRESPVGSATSVSHLCSSFSVKYSVRSLSVCRVRNHNSALMKWVSADGLGGLWKSFCLLGLISKSRSLLFRQPSASLLFSPSFHPWPHYPLPFTCWKERGTKLVGDKEESWI